MDNADIIRKNGTFLDKTRTGADSWLDADALLDRCTSRNERSRVLCQGYIMATADAYNSGGVPWKSCIPQGTGIDYLAAMFVDFRRRHPAVGNQQASVVVALLLRDNFPCPPR